MTALSGGVHSPRTVILNFRHGSILGHCDCQLGLLSRIDVRPTVLLRPYHCMPPLASTTRPRHAHNSPRQLAADEVVMETYYYGHLSVLIKRRSRYSCSTRIFALTYDLVFQSQAVGPIAMTHTLDAKNRGNRWVWCRPRQLLCFRCLTLLSDTAYIPHDDRPSISSASSRHGAKRRGGLCF